MYTTYLASLAHCKRQKRTLATATALFTFALIKHLQRLHGSSSTKAVFIVVSALVLVDILVLVDGIYEKRKSQG